MLRIKNEMDELLPESAFYDRQSYRLAPQIRKDLIERIKESKSLTDIAKQIGRSFKES
jgi:hypothetical protein